MPDSDSLELNLLLDEDQRFTFEERHERLSEIFNKYLIPALCQFTDTEAMLDFARTYVHNVEGWVALRPLLIAAGGTLPITSSKQ